MRVFLCVVLYVDFTVWLRDLFTQCGGEFQTYFLTCMPSHYLLSCKMFLLFAYNLTKFTLGLKKEEVLLQFLAVLDRLIHLAECDLQPIMFSFSVILSFSDFVVVFVVQTLLVFPVSLNMGESWRSQGNNNPWFFRLKSLICSKAFAVMEPNDVW